MCSFKKNDVILFKYDVAFHLHEVAKLEAICKDNSIGAVGSNTGTKKSLIVQAHILRNGPIF